MTKSLEQILENVIKIKDEHKNIQITNVCSDTREAKEGCLFIFKKGETFDSHDKLRDLEHIASAFISEKELDTDIPYYVIENTYDVMGSIASNFYGKPSENLTNIAITGTNGKTSTALIISHLLKELGKTPGYIGTNGIFLNGNQILENEKTPTTPPPIELQSILNKFNGEGATHSVIEATSQGLHYKRLDSVNFKYRIFTNFTKDHLDFHITMEEYLKAKLALFHNMTNENYAIINNDIKESHIIRYAAGEGKVITYGIEGQSNGSDFEASHIVLTNSGVSFKINKKYQFEANLSGKFNIYNILAAVVVLNTEGYSMEQISKAMNTFTGISGRLEKVNNDKRDVYVDYAHTPDALKNVLKTLRKTTVGNLITVFGAGGDRDKSKRPEMGRIAETYSDKIYITSDNPRTEDPMLIAKDIAEGLERVDYNVFLDREEAIRKAITRSERGDTILIAGKGHETYQIIGVSKYHFSDFEIAEKVLNKLK